MTAAQAALYERTNRKTKISRAFMAGREAGKEAAEYIHRLLGMDIETVTTALQAWMSGFGSALD